MASFLLQHPLAMSGNRDNHHRSNQPWPDNAGPLCEKWIRRASKYRWVYYEVENRYRKMHNIISGIKTILLALTPTTSFASPLDSLTPTTRLNITGGVGSAALVLNYLSSWMKADEQAHQFKHTVNQFELLINYITSQMLSRQPEDWDDFQHTVQRKFAEIHTTSPSPPFDVLVKHHIIDPNGNAICDDEWDAYARRHHEHAASRHHHQPSADVSISIAPSGGLYHHEEKKTSCFFSCCRKKDPHKEIVDMNSRQMMRDMRESSAKRLDVPVVAAAPVASSPGPRIAKVGSLVLPNQKQQHVPAPAPAAAPVAEVERDPEAAE